MANWYVWSGATAGGLTGVDWANAYISLETAVTGKVAGDVFWIAHDHIQTQASAALTITFPGTAAAPCKVYCVNRAGSVPPVSADLRTTAQINTTGTATITVTGTLSEFYGVRFSAGTSTGTSSLSLIGASFLGVFRNCHFRLAGTSVSSRITCGTSSASMCVLDNCTVQFGSTSQRMASSGRAYWFNTPVSTALQGSVPILGLFASSGNGTWHVEGVDLSVLGANKLADGTSAFAGNIFIKDCKLGSGGALAAAIPSYGAQEVYIIHSDNGDRNYRNEKHSYACSLTTETAIVRAGGASDGTTAIAWKFVTVATAIKEAAFMSIPITFWNDSTGGAPRIITIEGVWDDAATPLNTDIWLEVSYLGTNGFPLAKFVSTTLADNLATSATNYPPGDGTWTGGMIMTFAMSVTITPMEKGPVTIYVRAAKPSATFYIDPRPIVT
jgi:hypothetical protein